MREERTESEQLIDNAILLTLWAESQKHNNINAVGDRLKAQKLAFLMAYPLFNERIKALSLNFYRWKLGPLSNHVYDAWDDLQNSGLMIEEELFTVTQKGLDFADQFQNDVLNSRENKAVSDALLSVVNNYAAKNTTEILEKVYDMECVRADGLHDTVKVQDAEMQFKYTLALDIHESKEQVILPPGWQITLQLTFNQTARDSVDAGIRDAQEGRLLTWQEMWASV